MAMEKFGRAVELIAELASLIDGPLESILKPYFDFDLARKRTEILIWEAEERGETAPELPEKIEPPAGLVAALETLLDRDSFERPQLSARLRSHRAQVLMARNNRIALAEEAAKAEQAAA